MCWFGPRHPQMGGRLISWTRLPFYVISYCESYTSSSVHRSDRAVSRDVSISQLSPVTSDGPTHSTQSSIRKSSTTSVPQQKRVSRPQRRLRCVASSSSSSTEEVIHEEEDERRSRGVEDGIGRDPES